VRSKADTSQLNLPHGTNNKKCKKNKTNMLRSNSKSLANHVVSLEEETERLQWEEFAGYCCIGPTVVSLLIGRERSHDRLSQR